MSEESHQDMYLSQGIVKRKKTTKLIPFLSLSVLNFSLLLTNVPIIMILATLNVWSVIHSNMSEGNHCKDMDLSLGTKESRSSKFS